MLLEQGRSVVMGISLWACYLPWKLVISAWKDLELWEGKCEQGQVEGGRFDNTVSSLTQWAGGDEVALLFRQQG